MSGNRLAGLSRRGFLGVTGLAAAVAGGGYLWLAGNDDEYLQLADGAQPSLLSIKEYAVLTVLAGDIIRPFGKGPSVKDAMTALRIDRELLFHGDSSLADDFRAGLQFLEHAPAMDGLGMRYTSLSSADRQKFLASCAGSEAGLRRAAYAGVRFFTIFFYYSDDRTWPGIGYGGPLVDEKLFEGGNRIANLKLASGGTNQ